MKAESCVTNLVFSVDESSIFLLPRSGTRPLLDHSQNLNRPCNHQLQTCENMASQLYIQKLYKVLAAKHKTSSANMRHGRWKIVMTSEIEMRRTREIFRRLGFENFFAHVNENYTHVVNVIDAYEIGSLWIVFYEACYTRAHFNPSGMVRRVRCQQLDNGCGQCLWK